jgi:predicted nucleotide-binding protein/predicted RNA-binding Zn-ribbon protein involved in translation (DUF1610 family)
MNQNLLKILENYAYQVSYSKMENLTYIELRKIFRINESELNRFINELHEERLLEFKYNIHCPKCKEPDTILEDEMSNTEYECFNCGFKIDLPKEVKKGRVLISINREELLSYCKEENIDFTKESLKIVSIDIKKKTSVEKGDIRVIETKGEKKKMKIFLGSSKEAISDMENLALTIEELGHEHLMWNDYKAFPAGSYTMESLLRITKEVDAAIFIFNGEDKVWYRGDEKLSVRDNVLIEYGIFVGAKGLKHSIFECKNKPNIPTDLLGIVYIDGSQGKMQIKENLKSWMNSIL